MQRTLILLIATMAIAGTAHAGKLADGFRGIPYGDAAALEAPPMSTCGSSLDPAVKWVCTATIGEVPVTVSYAVMEGLYVGVMIKVSGYVHASELLATLQQAYGRGTKDHDWDSDAMADRKWLDGTVAAAWSWNQFSDEGEFIILDIEQHDLAELRKNERAKSGVDDL